MKFAKHPFFKINHREHRGIETQRKQLLFNLSLCLCASVPLCSSVTSIDFAPRCDRITRCQDDYATAARVRGGQEHSVAEFAAHLPWREVGDDDDLFADQLLGLIVQAKAGTDLPALAIGELDL